MKKYNKMNQKIIKYTTLCLGVMFLLSFISTYVLDLPVFINGLNYSVNSNIKFVGCLIFSLVGLSFLFISFNIKYSISLLCVSLILGNLTNLIHPNKDFTTMIMAWVVWGLAILFLLKEERKLLKS